MSFIIASVIVVLTILWFLIQVFAAGMSDAPGDGGNPWPALIGGFVLAGLIAASHWFPHVGW